MHKQKFVFIAFILAAFSAFAEDKHAPTMGVNLNLGTMPLGNFEARYELKLNDTVSFAFPVNFVYYKAALVRGILSKSIGGSVGAELKIHVAGKALQGGPYLAPTVKFGLIDHPTADRNNNLPPNVRASLDEKGKLSSYFRNNGWLRTGVLMGYDHVFDFGLMLDANIGLEHYYFFRAVHHNLTRPVFALSIGYAW